MSDSKLYATLNITIDNPYLKQSISVQVGNDKFPPANGRIYTEPLVVTVNDASTEPQNTDVTVIFNADGTINFELKNFVLSLGGNDMGVGNIALENLTVTEAEGGLKTFAYDGPLVITEGNKEGIDTWIGPILGEIPLVLVGKMSDDKLYVTIDIDMQEAIGQIIYVQVGTDDFAVSKKGDTNGDGNVDIADVVTVLNVMAEDTNEAAADINGDGSVDIADCVTVLNIMAE
jgi:biopolymer transport protein ExbD